MCFEIGRRKTIVNFINKTDKYSINCKTSCYQINISCWKTGYSWMMWYLLFLCCFPGGLGLVHNRRMVQGAPWMGQDFHTYPHPGQVPIMARDVMVDVVNNLGLRLLAIHNENNEDNIAISPYGALSILVALGEGLHGEAVRELQKAAHLPNDISIIRIGLRDIHRHLKSYFIPPEGFLAGLTLNHENVTLKAEYEEILHFYGFDIMSFNTALYPNPPTTQNSITSTADEKPDDITKATVPMEQPTTETTTSFINLTTLDSSITSTTATPISTTTIITIPTEFPMNDISPKLPQITTPRIESTTIEDVTSNTESSVLTTENISTAESSLTTTSEESTITNEPTITSTTEEVTTNKPTTAVITTTITEATTNSPNTEATATTNPTVPQSSTDTTEIGLSETVTTDKTTEAPSADSTMELITEVKPTESILTELHTTDLPPTELVVTEMPTTEIKSTESTVTTEVQSTESIVTEMPTTESIVTEMPTTEVTSSESTVITEVTSTESIVTEIPTTEVKFTESIVTKMPTPEVKPTEPTITTETTVTTEVKATESIATEIPTTEATVTIEVKATESIVSPTESSGSEILTTESKRTEPVVTEIITTPTVGTTGSEVVEIISTESLTTTEETILESTQFESNLSTETTEIVTEINGVVKRNTRSKVEMIKLNSPIRKTDASKPLSLANNRSRQRRSKRAYKENNKKPTIRKARSVVDYMIAKYYDSYRPLQPTHRVPYTPQTQPSFLVQGKYREYQVQFMKYDTWLPFFYVSHLKALALSFPLDSPRYYLLLLLPVHANGVDQLIHELKLNGSFKFILDNLRYRHVTAVIPSFLLKGYVNLTPTFQKLGLRRVFEPRQADFSPMTDFEGLYITNIEQAITVNIKHYMDPVAFGNSRQYRQEAPVEFRADHPFLYFVVDAELHVVLMTGKVVNPLNTRIT